jgi:pimeloyl-ACP methyl ester carboxylesterase
MISGTRGCSSRGGFAAPLHGGAMRRVLAYVLAASIPAAPVLAQPPDAKAVSITMEDVTYPHPVKFLEFSIYDEDVRLAYMDVAAEGTPNGRTVVLFHGMNFFGEYWAGPIDVLRRAGFRVVVPDQIGFGRSSKPVIPYNFHDMARNTKRLLDALGIARTAIVGHSMGGMLAARFATQYPDVVERVVIYNPIGLTDSRFGRPWTDEEDQYRRVLGQSYASASAGIRRYFAHDADAWKPEYEKYVLIHFITAGRSAGTGRDSRACARGSSRRCTWTPSCTTGSTSACLRWRSEARRTVRTSASGCGSWRKAYRTGTAGCT